MTVPIKVKIEFKRGADGEAKRKFLNRPTAKVARILAKAIKARFVKHGNPPRRYRYKGRSSNEFTDQKFISPRYPKISGGVKLASGAVMFDSSEDFHRKQNVKPGSFAVSGGMWKGLTVKQAGRIALIMFRGRSEGQGMRYQKGAVAHKNEPHWRFMKGKGKVVAKPKKVSNALKAATVLKSTRVPLLTPTKGETQAVASGVTAAIVSITKAIGVGPSAARVDWSEQDIMTMTQAGGSGKQTKLVREILRALSR